MTALGYDALGHPSPAAVKAAGGSFVLLYLKDTDAAQVAAYHAAGINVGLLAETSGRASLGGSAAGAQCARAALAAANAIGAPAANPDGSPVAVYVAEVDFDPAAADLTRIVEFYRGADTILGARLGGYGGYAAAHAVMADGHCRYFLQAYAWSAGRWEVRAQLEQYLNGQSVAGVGVDRDRQMVPDAGLWLAPNQGDAMSAADVTAINTNTTNEAKAVVTELQTLLARSTASILAAVHGLPAPAGAGPADPKALAAEIAPLLGPALLAELAAHPLTPKA